MASTINKFAHLQIPLQDIIKATDNFADANKIGDGVFRPAYKGRLILHSGKLMKKIFALRLDRKPGVGDSEFWTEISLLSDLRHTNLVSLIGFCDETHEKKHEKIIVMTHEANGSLGQYLNSPNLTWTQRLRIGVGVARALSYLHHDNGRSYGVIHRNINRYTILLDEKWEAKLSGFIFSVKQSISRMDEVVLRDPIIIPGYVDPVITKSIGVTYKSDIYSFGVILCEILCGRQAFTLEEGELVSLAKHHYEKGTPDDIILPSLSLWNQILSPKSLLEYSKIAYSCLKEEPTHRPDMKYIVAKLEKALELQERRENLAKNFENLKIPLSVIQSATDGFSKKYIIESSSDYALYRAELDYFDKENPSTDEGNNKGEHPKEHHRTVLIKRCLFGDEKYGEKECLTEIEILVGVKHRNIVTLHGFCIEGIEMILVAENVSNGYLSNYLGNVRRYKSILTWEKRLKVCIDVANALNHLHQKMIIIGDICSYNIVLDENQSAKIISFGDSIVLPPNEKDKAIYLKWLHREPHIDPTYRMADMLKIESNVYSFGVVLLEILCGREATEGIYYKGSKNGLADVARRSFTRGTLEDMIDPIIKEEINENNFVFKRGPNKESLHLFMKIAYECVKDAQDQRPTMEVVIKELEKALSLQQNNKEDPLCNFQMLRMSIEDVKLATQNFHVDNCIGGGRSFKKIYKGKVPQGDGYKSIVVKRLDTMLLEGKHQFLNELLILLVYKHGNIIGLIGYCDEMDEKIIGYEYMTRRSLDRYLNDASLTWERRLNISIDVARALDFLHGRVGRKGNVMVHMNIKTDNILLNDVWNAKLAGFDHSLISLPNQETHNDIYSFGVVLFEILCGRSMSIHKNEEQSLQHFLKNNFEEGKHDDVVFQQIKDQIMPKSLKTFQRIAYQCLHHKRNNRPTAKKVLIQLKKALEFQEERIHCSNTDQLVNKLQLTRETFGKNLKIPLSVILSATDDFSKTYIIDSSDDQYDLYRAELDHFDNKENSPSVEGNSRTVLIKRWVSEYDEDCVTEIEKLTSVQHPNIVTLLGFCVEDSEMIIVLEDVSNGFLSEYIGNVNKKHVFTWEKRLKICIDVARALNYLHYKMGDQKIIINRGICSDSIGLDENFGAKIADFRNSLFLPPNQEDEALYLDLGIGRDSYIDPEYAETGKLKRESDVFSFGVVLFEILFGRRANDRIFKNGSDEGLASSARQSFLMGTLEDIIDHQIKEEINTDSFALKRGPNKDSLQTFIEVAHQCVAETQNQRPTLKVVLKKLEKALIFQKNNNDNPKMSLEDIKLVTQNFHKNNYIGRGGFGMVYKGVLPNGDEIVAKRLYRKSAEVELQFLSELQIVLGYKHENIIGLVGYCYEKDEKIIVYEYASRRSLDWYLKDATLTWVKRLGICIDVASALDFLHGGAGKQGNVIHRDIKTANILLTHDWKAKLADFGLSLISPITHETDYVIDHICGTRGYMDPLYEKSRFLTMESDIYSFGVVLFEILCGRFFTGKFLSSFVKDTLQEGKHDEVVFDKIREQIEPSSLKTFEKIAYNCLHDEREKRPTAKKVLAELKKALTIQNMTSTLMTKFAPLQIPLEDIVEATNNFHRDNIIENGGFGTSYKGRLFRFGSSVMIAAQRFDCDFQFLTKISMLSHLKHTNLVSIIGFCYEKDQKIIITTYEANGSLGQYLNSSNLTWTQRLRICVGVARALSYLFYDEGRDYVIIHCNINSDTILLDENWEAKLSGFEISVKQSVCHKDQVCLFEHIGAMGCMDPAIKKTGGVTHKSDIYSFAVVLYEVLCGRKAFIDNDANSFLVPLVKYHYENKTLGDIIHTNLVNQMSPRSLVKHSKTAYSCLKDEPACRPDMDHIVAKLEKALELQLRRENNEKKFEHLKIRLRDIKLATDNFSEKYKIAYRENLTLYRAKLNYFGKENHSFVEGNNKSKRRKGHNTVLIKRYPSMNDVYTEGVFFTEIEVLTSVKHPNIVTLLGFCVEGSEMILVIDNVSNGFFRPRLGSVTWENRLRICIDVAHALNYLHYEMEDQKMIINRSIMSGSIGLDDNLRAKIFDFGFSLYLPPGQVDEALYGIPVCGSPFYWDPEYDMTGKLKRESDVYSFGVIMFEVLCGRRASHPIYKRENENGLAYVARQNFGIGKIENMIDPILKKETAKNNFSLDIRPNKESLHTFIEIAYKCVEETQNQRPTMKVVVKELERALDLHLCRENIGENWECLKIPLSDIKMATKKFSKTHTIVSWEHSTWYRAELPANHFDKENPSSGKNKHGHPMGHNSHKTVVLKRTLFGNDWYGAEEFFAEIEMLTVVKHPNIVTLLGYCVEGSEMILVTDNVFNGYLDDYLETDEKRRILTWENRLKICIDVARALNYLHYDMEGQKIIINRNIMSGCIGLDENWGAKISDFSYSLYLPLNQVDEALYPFTIYETPFYSDPKTGKLKRESDVYSFGVVLLEILCGRLADDPIYLKESDKGLAHVARQNFYIGKLENMIDPILIEENVENSFVLNRRPNEESLRTFIKIANQCVAETQEQRPTMKVVVKELEKALDLQLHRKEIGIGGILHFDVGSHNQQVASPHQSRKSKKQKR